MSTTATDRRMWTIQQYEPIPDPDSTEPDHAELEGERRKAEATARLRDIIRNHGYVLDYETIEPTGSRTPIRLLDDQGNWAPATEDDATGHVVTWHAGARERLSDDYEVSLQPDPPGPGPLRFRVPEALTQQGGGARLEHGLGGPVTCLAYSDSGQGVGYEWAIALDDDQEQIQLVPGVSWITVELDPEDDDEQDGQEEQG